ncbi:uncharacterized protein LOC126614377 [Malus sylvestris]|uniref:uncharacterized protein LOC126614377 n=1 Tax=Malus sylvestris TaxID=3752 RepID=UPI0021AC52BF|nr:uncharacterized protein LOC126614377 [Malus sylvestris]
MTFLPSKPAFFFFQSNCLQSSLRLLLWAGVWPFCCFFIFVSPISLCGHFLLFLSFINCRCFLWFETTFSFHSRPFIFVQLEIKRLCVAKKPWFGRARSFCSWDASRSVWEDLFCWGTYRCLQNFGCFLTFGKHLCLALERLFAARVFLRLSEDHLLELQPYRRAAKIKVRICRIWKPDIPGMDGKSMGLHCILVHNRQDAIEACSTEMNHEVLASKVQAGNCYEITNFRINRIKGEYIVVPNDSQTVFTHKTVFKRITNEFPRILHHRFFLQDYNMLYPRLDRVDILTDVVGHVKGMQHLEPK